jgi:hypothetical protein
MNIPSLRKLERTVVASDANIQRLSRFRKDRQLEQKPNIQDVCEVS